MQEARHELIAALSERSESLIDTIINAMRADLPAYRNIGDEHLVPAASQTLHILLGMIGHGGVIGEAEAAALSAHGELRGRQGIPLPEMFGAWRLAVRITVRELVRLGRERGLDDHELLDLTTVVLESGDAAIQIIARGHHEVEHDLARQHHQRRSDLVHGILWGTMSADDIGVQADRYGLDPNGTYHAVRCRVTSRLPVAKLEQALGVGAVGPRPAGLTAIIDGDLAGVLAQPPVTNLATAIGFGPPCRLFEMEPSFRQATRALETATAFGMAGAFDLAGLGLLSAVVADSEVGECLIARYLAPLGDGDSAAAILDAVAQYFAHNQRADLTAQAMHLHTNTVRYRLHRYQELSGADLHDLGQTLEIWWALQYRTVRDRTVRP